MDLLTSPTAVQVVDNVLKDHSASDPELYNRARGLLLLGAIFKSTVPDESDEERRELERCVPFFLFFCCTNGTPPLMSYRMVAEAAKPRKKQAPPSAAMQAAQIRAHEVRHTHANGHTTAGPASHSHTTAAPASASTS
jgi:hypothetical protein